MLLAVAPGERAAEVLRERLEVEADPVRRADSILGLALHDPSERTGEVLGRFLAGADSLDRCCAALTAIRCRFGALTDDARQVLIELLAGSLDVGGFGKLFFGSG